MDRHELREHLTGEAMKNKARPQGEVWWCIKSGKILLPFTARITRRDAIDRRVHRIWNYCSNLFSPSDQTLLNQGKLPSRESVVRIRVVEEKKGEKS